jgi:hypothetical protein
MRSATRAMARIELPKAVLEEHQPAARAIQIGHL